MANSIVIVVGEACPAWRGYKSGDPALRKLAKAASLFDFSHNSNFL
jgi:hypothetical protein